MLAYYRILKNALRALTRNPMRSALTCLGIIIGVAAVIAIVEIGNGTTALIQHDIAAMGSNVLVIMPGAAVTGGINWGQGSAMSLKPTDCRAILRESPSINSIAPVVWGGKITLTYGDENWQPANTTGTTPQYLTIRNWGRTVEGRSFTEQDVRDAAEVCIIGQTVAHGLFGNGDPVGKMIRAQNVMLRVIGVLRAKGANMNGNDQDDVFIAPWTTMKFRIAGNGIAQTTTVASAIDTTVNSLNNLYPTASVVLYPVASDLQQADTPQPIRFPSCNQILCTAASQGAITKAIEQIHAALRARHHIRSGLPDDFQVINTTELMRARTRATRTMTLLLICVAMISLVVGGVGIMNIMLVSVTERTREIGLRMAVGAKSGDILRQFLVEAILLCILGGITGVILGRGSSWLIGKFKLFPTQMSLTAIFAAVLVSGAVGVIFGFYPAWKASRLDPIEALRYE
ncbi:MAG TPA: ABC transporter permease [Tepidisphaeraceae bacterium]|jgi:ABC-type antimicrobial peptide transport system permease subunit|nr:ABC transporter permease [Tepidisphaeraceae bacterium]